MHDVKVLQAFVHCTWLNRLLPRVGLVGESSSWTVDRVTHKAAQSLSSELSSTSLYFFSNTVNSQFGTALSTGKESGVAVGL